ncbi:hypothetical protein PR048_029533 [Dryococelus australis]|uniref:Uncharacterized protein n=1 Tax=Dryococelus australis TaxID=614101 RepID=A0ABQ9GDM6_9NEOP|nr:hypothetical protein PR048_029533 [Dryococelus australis]
MKGQGGNGISPRKPADERHRPARFPRAKYRHKPVRTAVNMTIIYRAEPKVDIFEIVRRLSRPLSSISRLLGLSRVVDFFCSVSAVVAAAITRERHLTNRRPARRVSMTWLIERLECSPPTKANRIQSLRISASENRAGRCHSSAGLLRDLPFPPPPHSGAAPFSPHYTLIGSQGVPPKSPNSAQLEHCAPVESVALSCDGALDVRGSVALIASAPRPQTREKKNSDSAKALRQKMFSAEHRKSVSGCATCLSRSTVEYNPFTLLNPLEDRSGTSSNRLIVTVAHVRVARYALWHSRAVLGLSVMLLDAVLHTLERRRVTMGNESTVSPAQGLEQWHFSKVDFTSAHLIVNSLYLTCRSQSTVSRRMRCTSRACRAVKGRAIHADRGDGRVGSLEHACRLPSSPPNFRCRRGRVDDPLTFPSTAWHVCVNEDRAVRSTVCRLWRASGYSLNHEVATVGWLTATEMTLDSP